MKRLLFVLFVTTGCVAMMGCAGSRPDNLGITNGKLADCPSSPNCVNSQAADDDHAVAPLTYEGSRKAAFSQLKNAVASLKRTKIIEERDDYLRIECKSAIMRFVDDVEFYFPEEKIIHVRSASRLGYSDLGVNRDRVAHIRALFEAESGAADVK